MFYVWGNVNAIFANTPDSAYLNRKDVRKAMGLYTRTVADTAFHKSCAQCHPMQQQDTFVFSPSILEIQPATKAMSFEDFDELIHDAWGSDALMDAHVDMHFDSLDLLLLKKFIETYPSNAFEKKKIHYSLYMLAIGVVLLLFVLPYLVIAGWKKNRWSFYLVFIAGLGSVLFYVFFMAFHEGHSPGYSPRQPIKFSHLLHAAENEIDCMYCHYQQEGSNNIGIPTTELCMQCHMLVREGANAGEFELKKLIAAWDNHAGIEWVKVQHLPDHVFFNHAAHIDHAGLDCAECHGEVEAMHQVSAINRMSMGWCLDCHRDANVNMKTVYFHNYFTAYDSLPFTKLGGEDCSTCHH